MVERVKEVAMIWGSPTRKERTRYICDSCDCYCSPHSNDPKDWLYRLNGEDLCFDCLLSETGAEIRTE